jgi:hypothetical protein
MRLRISVLAALLLAAALPGSGSAGSPRAATTSPQQVRSASLVRSGGFVYYRHVLATVRPAETAALAALSAFLPRPLPPHRRPVLCADCRTTRLDLVLGSTRVSYVWDAAPPRSLRPLVAALVRHG